MSLEDLQDDGARRLHSANVKLLVIEDDLKLARLLTRVLQEEGYVVDGCSKGESGLRQASSGLYDLVVLDWMLPISRPFAVPAAARAAAAADPDVDVARGAE
jgi:DNA-binding response OmpR family regulator